MPRVSGTLLGPRQAILTDTRCLIDSFDRGEHSLAPGLNILCVAAACTCQFPNLSDVLTSVSMGLGNDVEVALSIAQQPSLHFFSPVHILGSSRKPCPSSPTLLPGLEGAENLSQDAVAAIKPPTPLSLLPKPLPPGIQKVNPSPYLVARWSEGSFPPLVTRWSRLSLKMHTEGMRNSKRDRCRVQRALRAVGSSDATLLVHAG